MLAFILLCMLLKIQLISQISQRNVVLSQRALAAAEQRLAIDVDWQRGKISTHEIDASLAMSNGELCRRRVDCARRLVARAHTNVRVAQVAVDKRRETPAAEARVLERRILHAHRTRHRHAIVEIDAKRHIALRTTQVQQLLDNVFAMFLDDVGSF